VKKALILGVNGQDGQLLKGFLLGKNYLVIGVSRSTQKTDELANPNYSHEIVDTTNATILRTLLATALPDEIYNLAAQSHVGRSFKDPLGTMEVNAFTVMYILEELRLNDNLKKTRFFQASSGEIYGSTKGVIRREESDKRPNNIYGISKLLAHSFLVNYRESYNMFVVNGILFNHESELRPETFVTGKILHSVKRIAQGRQDKLVLGNIEARKDWGDAKEYVECMWLSLQQARALDYIIATGKTHSVKDLVTEAFKLIDIDIVWEGEGISEKGVDLRSGNVMVEVSEMFFRPLETLAIPASTSFTKETLKWEATSGIDQLVEKIFKRLK